MKADEIHLAIPATGEYRKWAEVTAASAIANSSLPVKVHYIDWSVIDRARLERLGSWHGSAIAFSRLYLAELFPDLDWVITCDADIMFRGDIAELWALRDESVSFIAHKDCPLPPHPYTQSHFDSYKEHGLELKDWNMYCVDGLGLANLKRWREKGYQKEFERLAEKCKNLASPDQMIINFVLQGDMKLLPVEWGCFSGDENADVDWSKPGAVHFVEDQPWKRSKITHLSSDLVEEWWDVAEFSGIDLPKTGYRGCKNKFDWLWRRCAFLFLKRNQWMLRLNFKFYLHLRSTRGVDGVPPAKGKKILHIVPGLCMPGNGISVAARLIAKSQNAAVCDAKKVPAKAISAADEVWVHSMWTPQVCLSCIKVLRSGKRLVRMTHANLDPRRLACKKTKKRLAGTLEKRLLRMADSIVATCPEEEAWIKAYEPRVKSVETVDLAEFFDFSKIADPLLAKRDVFNVLYLGRRHPLKGMEYLEEAVKRIKESGNKIELRMVSDVTGEEKERIWKWCDILVLPTLSENFGLVVAEALERGKLAITTDGAPVWATFEDRHGKPGKLTYLKGFCAGNEEMRVEMLQNALLESYSACL